MTSLLPRANLPLTDAFCRSVALTLATEQIRFLSLHTHHIVSMTRWHWRSTIVRAYADNGDRATITAAQFDELVRLNFIRRIGVGAEITTMGRRAVT